MSNLVTDLKPITLKQYESLKKINLCDHLKIVDYGKPYDQKAYGPYKLLMRKTATTYVIEWDSIDPGRFNVTMAQIGKVLTKLGFIEGTHWIRKTNIIFARIEA